MYNSGDDLSAIVCDPGSLILKTGYAGDDFPRSLKNSVRFLYTTTMDIQHLSTLLSLLIVSLCIIVCWYCEWKR
jgi:hypothetical protein